MRVGAQGGDLRPFAGAFSGPGRGRELELTVTVDAGTLVIKAGEGEPRRLAYVDSLTFASSATRYHFVRNGPEVTGLQGDEVAGYYVLRRVKDWGEEGCVATLPTPVATFLSGHRFAVAGVSRDAKQAANAVYRKLKASGYEVIPVNPNAAQVEGVRCYPDLRSIPGSLDGLMIAAHPRVATQLVRECAERGVKQVWFHRSFGQGSVSDEAVQEAQARGISCIVGGCPLMYYEPVDIGHRCIRWWLKRRGRVL